jgi:hypothetical protein
MVLIEKRRDLVVGPILRDVLRRIAVDMAMQILRHTPVDKIMAGTTAREEAYRVVTS